MLNGSEGKESPYKAGDTGDVGFTPGLGRSPEGVSGYPTQHFGLDRGAWLATAHRVTKSWIQLLSSAHTHRLSLVSREGQMFPTNRKDHLVFITIIRHQVPRMVFSYQRALGFLT